MKANKHKEEKIESAFSVITPNYIQVPDVIDCKGTGKYIKYGMDNKFPNYLWDNFLKCSNLQAIIQNITDYVAGNGITTDWNISNTDGETLEEVVKHCVLDYLIFGGFAVECIRNKKGEVVNLLYQNIMNVRVNEELTTAYLCNDWQSWHSKNVKELPLYDRNISQPHFIYYYKGNLSRNIYPVPVYMSALKSIEILNNTRTFHLRNLENNFNVNAIINFNNGKPTKEVQKEINDKLTKKFSGAENSGKFLVQFNDSKEHETTISRLETDKFGELYQALQDSSVADVFTAFRINPILVGVNVSTGFSKQEFKEAFTLFNRTVVTPICREIEKQFYKLGINFKFNRFQLEEEESEVKNEE